ncbi:unnamed protein product [Rhizopus stolonifer]
MRVGKSPDELSSELMLLVGNDYDPNVTQWFYDRKRALENPETSRVEEPSVENNRAGSMEKDTRMLSPERNMSERSPNDDDDNDRYGRSNRDHDQPRARVNRDDRIFSRAIGNALNPNKERHPRERQFSPIRYRSRSRSRSPENNSHRVISREDRYIHEDGKSSSRIHPRVGGSSDNSSKDGRRSVFDRLGTVNSVPAQIEEDTKVQRCKYWPTCKNGEQCPYFHPSAVCPDFPKCPNQASECMFIHPETVKQPSVAALQQPTARLPYPCKFFPYCSNPVCPYIHPLPQQSYYMQAQPSYPTNQRVPIPCKNGNECTRPNCHFLHPKDENNYAETVCKYDGSCTRPNCFYKHTKENTMENTKNKVLINKLENTNGRQFSVPEDQIEERIIVGESADMIRQDEGATQQNNSNGVSGMELDGDAVTDAKP